MEAIVDNSQPKGIKALIAKMKSNKDGFKLTKEERNWALYDAGNSAIYMFLILVSVSIADLAYGTSGTNPTQLMSWFNAGTGIIVALLGPIMGAIADNRGRKKPLFKFFVYMGLFGCYSSLLANFSAFAKNDAGFAWGFFVPFAISLCFMYVGLGGSLLFYDSMLGDVTTEERSDRVSSYGFAYGYIFSLIPFCVCLAIYYFFMDPQWSYENISFIKTLEQGYIALRLAITICLAISATWWYFMTRPLLKNYVQISGVDPVKHQVRDAFKKLAKTFGELKHYKHAFLFMLAFFCYINGVNTVIALSATYASDILTSPGVMENVYILGEQLTPSTTNNLSVMLVVALMMTQVIACIFSILFGKLSKNIGARNLIMISVIGYLVFVVYAVFMGKTGLPPLADFFILAAGVGVFQGGIQALSRSYFCKLIPSEKQSEFFGLYDIFNKSSNFLGSLLFAAITLGLEQNQGMHHVQANRIAVACLSVFFVVGLAILFFIPKNHADEVVSV